MREEDLDKNKLTLTKTQRKILDMLDSGVEDTEVIAELGVDRIALETAISAISKNDLILHFPNVFTKVTEPPHFDDDEVIQQMSIVGFPHKVVQSVRKRLAIRNGQEKMEVKSLSERELIGALDKKVAHALYFLDDFTFAASSAKELAGVIDIMIEKIQLLKGKPTSITSIEDRRKINELLPVLMEEARRRGVVIEGSAVDVTGH